MASLFRHPAAQVARALALACVLGAGTTPGAEPAAPRLGPQPAPVAHFDVATYAPSPPLPGGFEAASLHDRDEGRFICKTATFDRATCSQAALGLFAAWTRERRGDTGGSVRVEARVLPLVLVSSDRDWAQGLWVQTHGASQLREAALRIWRKPTGRVAESDVQWGKLEESPAWGLARYEERQGFILYVYLHVDGRPTPAVRAELRRAFIDGPLGAPATESPASVDPASPVSPGSPAAAAPSVSTGPVTCPAVPKVSGFSHCYSVELTGAPPCEVVCQRTRTPPKEDPCCEGPVEVVVLAGGRTVFRIDACRSVPPQCANTHGHGRMDAHLRVLSGSPPELLVVEGGCEARALAHGYVPPGVAAWSGCRHQRYRWNGQTFVAK